MELAPICIFSYNRPDHLRKTLYALSQNELAGESVLYIFCDGAKELLPENVADVDSPSQSAKKYFSGNKSDYKKYLSDLKANVEVAKGQIWPKELYVVERERNYGLAANIVDAVTTVVNKFGRVITLEDDIITSKGFLKYMNEALEVYKDEENVMHISAYMYPHKRKLPNTFFYPVPYPGGGWATWQRAWCYYNDNTQVLYEFWKDRWAEFDLYGGDYLSKQLRLNLEGQLNTWFVKWHAVMRQRNALTLYPGVSLTNNIGFDNTATNCFAMTKFDVNPVDYVEVEKCQIKVNKRASRIIYDFYQGHWYNKRRREALLKKILGWLHISL